MTKRMKICHMTTVHSKNDVRIFLKECCSLANECFETHFIVPGERDEIVNSVHIHCVNKNKTSRFYRMTKRVLDVYKKAKSINADLYHFHDPELIPVGLLLTGQGRKVIYDTHEDVPRDILTKEWIPQFLRKILAEVFERFENWAARKIRFIVTATPYIRERFDKLGCSCIDINNYPIIHELVDARNSWFSKEKVVCYIGTMEKLRGTAEMIVSVQGTDSKLVLAGIYSPLSHREEVKSLQGWDRVEDLGLVERSEVKKILSRSMCGLVLFHPAPNHNNSQPNKLFEYMSAGIPVICSNFDLWKKIVEEGNCGICVDSLNTKEISDAIKWITEHPEDAERMGKNGQRLIVRKYNWETEKQKLLLFYRKVLSL